MWLIRALCNCVYGNNHGERGEHGEKKVKSYRSACFIPVFSVFPVVVLSVYTNEIRSRLLKQVARITPFRHAF